VGTSISKILATIRWIWKVTVTLARLYLSIHAVTKQRPAAWPVTVHTNLVRELAATCHVQVSEPDVKNEESDESDLEDTGDDVGKKKGVDKVPRNLGLMSTTQSAYHSHATASKKYKRSPFCSIINSHNSMVKFLE